MCDVMTDLILIMSENNIFSHRIFDVFGKGKGIAISLFNIVKEHPVKSSLIALPALMIILLKKYYHSFLYHPNVGYGRHNSENPKGMRSPADRQLDFDQLNLQTQDGVHLKGWHLKSPHPSRIVVFFHENAGNIGTRLPYLHQMLLKLHCDVIIVAYRGFSDSQNAKITQNGIQKDAITIMDYALQSAAHKKLKLYVFGRSLGGAVGIYISGLPQFKQKISGLILENTFTSINDVAFSILPLPISIMLYPVLYLVLRSSWTSLRRIKDIQAPILLIKGCKDELVPKTQMDNLQAECKRLKHDCFSYQIKEGTHNEMWTIEPETYWSRIHQYCHLIQKKSHL